MESVGLMNELEGRVLQLEREEGEEEESSEGYHVQSNGRGDQGIPYQMTERERESLYNGYVTT